MNNKFWKLKFWLFEGEAPPKGIDRKIMKDFG